VVGLFVAGTVGLALFVAQESRSASPLLPLRIVADRNRGGAYLAAALAVVGMYGMFLRSPTTSRSFCGSRPCGRGWRSCR
jgi:hypothetical protein